MFFVLTLLSCLFISSAQADGYTSNYYYNQKYQSYNKQREDKLKISKVLEEQPKNNQCIAENQTSCSAKILDKSEPEPTYTPIIYNKDCGNPRCFFIAATGGLSHTVAHSSTPTITQKVNSDPFYGFTIGANATDRLKIGLEWLNTTRHIDSKAMGDLSFRSTTIIPNIYLMMPHSTIRPYIVFGIGAAYNKLTDKNSLYKSNSDAKLAYQLGAGLNFNYEKLFLNTEIKYLDRGTATATSKSNSSNVQKIKLQDVLFGIALGCNL